MSAAIAEPPDAPETADTPDIPSTERQAINNMADKLKAAMGQIVSPPALTKPAEQKPVAQVTPTVTPPATSEPQQPEIPKEPKSHKDWKVLMDLRAKAEAEAKQFKTELDMLKAKPQASVEEFEKLKTAATERDQLKAELETARKGSAEYEEAKKRLADQDQIIKQIAIEHSPEFQSHFGQRFQNALVEAKEAVGAEHAAQVETAFQVPPSAYRDQQVAALGESLSEFQKAALVAAYTDLKRTERERAAELKKAPENYQKLQELQAERAKQEEAKVIENRNVLLAQITSQIDPELNGAEATLVQAVKNRTRKVVEGSASRDEFVEVLIDAARGKKYSTVVKEQAEKIGKLETQLAELQGAQPGVQTSAAAPASRKTAINPDDHTDIGVKFRKYRDELPAKHRATGAV